MNVIEKQHCQVGDGAIYILDLDTGVHKQMPNSCLPVTPACLLAFTVQIQS